MSNRLIAFSKTYKADVKFLIPSMFAKIQI